MQSSQSHDAAHKRQCDPQAAMAVTQGHGEAGHRKRSRAQSTPSGLWAGMEAGGASPPARAGWRITAFFSLTLSDYVSVSVYVSVFVFWFHCLFVFFISVYLSLPICIHLSLSLSFFLIVLSGTP